LPWSDSLSKARGAVELHQADFAVLPTARAADGDDELLLECSQGSAPSKAPGRSWLRRRGALCAAHEHGS